jgi:hypothetical protein
MKERKKRTAEQKEKMKIKCQQKKKQRNRWKSELQSHGKRKLNFIGSQIGVAKCLNRYELIDKILEETMSRRKEIHEEMPIEEFASKIQEIDEDEELDEQLEKIEAEEITQLKKEHLISCSESDTDKSDDELYMESDNESYSENH